jgi:hypothetical protein
MDRYEEIAMTVSNIDERRGLVKTDWAIVRSRVAKVNPTLTEIIDEINPGKNFPLYLAYYLYGEIICDTTDHLLPHEDDTCYYLKDAQPEVLKDLGYGVGAAPLTLILEKNVEFFIDMPEVHLTIPELFCKTGTIFPLGKLAYRNTIKNHASTKILSIQSGARSSFILPNIGQLRHHIHLKRKFSIHEVPPKNLYDQVKVFKALSKKIDSQNKWRSCLMYFSQSWINELKKDNHKNSAWFKLRIYLDELSLDRFSYDRNYITYAHVFSLFKRNRYLKPNPYLADMAQHLFAIAAGAAAGYKPSTDEQSLPLKFLQKIYAEDYKLNELPTFIEPAYFDVLDNNALPIYDSFNYPATPIFSPKARKEGSILTEMDELDHILKNFLDEFQKKNTIISDTILGNIASKLEFRFFHNQNNRYKKIILSSEMPKFDARLKPEAHFFKGENTAFGSEGAFARGCISISLKDND